MRVNGQINEVKQLLAWAILGWVTLWQPQFFLELGRKVWQIRQICEICQLSLNYGKLNYISTLEPMTKILIQA